MATCWGLDSSLLSGAVTDCERALGRKVEGQLTCAKVVRFQDHQVLRGCQEDHRIACYLGGWEGKAGRLSWWNLVALIPGACPGSAPPWKQGVTGSGYRRKTLGRQNPTFRINRESYKPHFLGTPFPGQPRSPLAALGTVCSGSGGGGVGQSAGERLKLL